VTTRRTAHCIHFRDPHSPEMTELLESIPTCPGTCLFIDVSGSTRIKYEQTLVEWGRKLNNTFNILLYANHLETFIVKGIGDEIMLFIPDEELKSRASDNDYYSLVENVHAALFLIRQRREGFLTCKVAIHYCTEAYHMTYFEQTNDFYGRDIDLTARLMTKCIENRIVLSERCFEKVKQDVARMNRPLREGCLATVSGKRRAIFAGVPTPTAYRVIDP
jgi:class 3 adenylate cyclase